MARLDLDAGHQRADLVEQLVGRHALVHQVVVQVLDHACVAIRDARVERHRLGRLIHRIQFTLQLLPLGFHRWQARLDRGRDRAGNYPVDDLLNTARKLGDAAAQLAAVAPAGRGEERALLVIGLQKGGDHFRIVEVLAQRLQHSILDVLARDRAAVGAVLSFAMPRAYEAATVDGRVAGAAATALEQAAEDVTRFPDVRRMGNASLGATGLDGCERGAVDDRELRSGSGDPLAFRVRPRDALAGCGVLDEALPVPDDLAGIKTVLQDTVLPDCRADDGRCVPFATPRAGHTFGVEVAGNLAARAAGEVGGEDAPHRLCLSLDDSKLAAIGARLIAERAAPADGTLAHARRLAAAGLLREVG